LVSPFSVAWFSEKKIGNIVFVPILEEAEKVFDFSCTAVHQIALDLV